LGERYPLIMPTKTRAVCARRFVANYGPVAGHQGAFKIEFVWAGGRPLWVESGLREVPSGRGLKIDRGKRRMEFPSPLGCDAHDSHLNARVVGRTVQFEITEKNRAALFAWTWAARLRSSDYVFPGRTGNSPHLSTGHYARMVHRWVREIALDSAHMDTLDAANEGCTHLPTHQEPSGDPAIAWPQQAREHGPLAIEVDDALEASGHTKA
jgi:hypothetical protein